MTKVIERVTEISAPAETVWDVLLDVHRYDEWNPFLTLDAVPARVGQRLRVTVRAGKRTMSFQPTITAFEPGHRVCWLGHLLVPHIVDGAHELRVESIDAVSSRFTHRETFSGVLVPFLRRTLRDTDAGFAAMNAALAQRASSFVTAPGGRR